MVEFGVFLYGLCAGLVLMNAQRSRQTEQPLSPMVTALGWGLMSMSSVLAVLLFAVALAMALGGGGPLLDALAAG